MKIAICWKLWWVLASSPSSSRSVCCHRGKGGPVVPLYQQVRGPQSTMSLYSKEKGQLHSKCGVWVGSRKMESIWKVSMSLLLTGDWTNPIANILGLVTKSATIEKEIFLFLIEIQSRRVQMSYTMWRTSACQFLGGLGKMGLERAGMKRHLCARKGILFPQCSLEKDKGGNRPGPWDWSCVKLSLVGQDVPRQFSFALVVPWNGIVLVRAAFGKGKKKNATGIGML